jgi:hypothetical protein
MVQRDVAGRKFLRQVREVAPLDGVMIDPNGDAIRSSIPP